jgi:hypothetical protein
MHLSCDGLRHTTACACFASKPRADQCYERLIARKRDSGVLDALCLQSLYDVMIELEPSLGRVAALVRHCVAGLRDLSNGTDFREARRHKTPS